MKTLAINVWTIDEHPNKEAVLETLRNWPNMYGHDYENVASLKAFCDCFSLASLDYEVSTCSPSHATAKIDNDLEELRYVRLWKYLQNNFNLAKLLDGSCPFTGCGFDETLLDPIRVFIKKPTDIDYQELIDNCLSAWVTAYLRDWEYAYSDEALTETAECNEWYFTGSGELE